VRASRVSPGVLFLLMRGSESRMASASRPAPAHLIHLHGGAADRAPGEPSVKLGVAGAVGGHLAPQITDDPDALIGGLLARGRPGPASARTSRTSRGPCLPTRRQRILCPVGRQQLTRAKAVDLCALGGHQAARTRAPPGHAMASAAPGGPATTHPIESYLAEIAAALPGPGRRRVPPPDRRHPGRHGVITLLGPGPLIGLAWVAAAQASDIGARDAAFRT